MVDMNNKETISNESYVQIRAYYENALCTMPFYCKFLPFVSFPKHDTNMKMMMIAIIISFIGWHTSLPAIVSPFMLVMVLILKVKYDLREDVIENCVVEEWILSQDLAKNGGDPYFPQDPDHVVDSDREYIFRIQSRKVKNRFKRTPFSYIIKKYLRFTCWLLIIQTFLTVCYSLTNGEPVAWFNPSILASNNNKNL